MKRGEMSILFKPDVIQIHFIMNHVSVEISIPRNSFDLTKSAGNIHSLCP